MLIPSCIVSQYCGSLCFLTCLLFPHCRPFVGNHRSFWNGVSLATWEWPLEQLIFPLSPEDLDLG